MVDRRRVRGLVAGFAGAALVFAVLFWLVGIDRILDALGRADLRVVAAVAALMALWVVVQGVALWVVTGSLDLEVPPGTAVLVYAGTAFMNNVTPFAQAGGAPIGAKLLSDGADADYETALATVLSANAVDFVPSTTLALVGLAAYATRASLSPRIEVAAALVVAFVSVVVAGGVVVWRRRTGVERVVVALATPPLRLATRVVPGVGTAGADRIEAGFEQFFEAFDRVAADRRRLAAAVGVATCGLLLQAGAMWLTFLALGEPIPPQVPLFVIPVGTMAAGLPTPGGLGGIESVHLVLLAATTSVGAPVVAAAIVIHRIGGFWLTNLIGGAAMAVLRARERAPPVDGG